MLQEFKKFAMRGNVVDMAVGIIIGGAFGTIVKSLVADVIMPPVGLLLGGVDFSNPFLTLKEGAVAGPYATLAAAQEAGAVTVSYGLFLNAVISFLIVAFAVFLLIKSINKLKPNPRPRIAPFAAAVFPSRLHAAETARLSYQQADLRNSPQNRAQSTWGVGMSFSAGQPPKALEIDTSEVGKLIGVCLRAAGSPCSPRQHAVGSGRL